MPPKKEQPLVINKKAILHFELDSLVFEKSAQAVEKKLALMFVKHAWGKPEKKDEKSPVVWKLVQNSISLEPPEDCVSYYSFLEQKFGGDTESIEEGIANFMKTGNPGLKLKTEFDKACRALFLSKNQQDIVRAEAENKDDHSPEYRQLCARLAEGKFQILPHFFKLMMTLRKQKREFAVVLHCKEVLPEVVAEFDLFCAGEHPLYNGRNGTSLVKFDGSKGYKDYQLRAKAVSFGPAGCVFGTLAVRPGESPLADRYREEGLRVCNSVSESYVAFRETLKECCSVLVVEAGQPLHFLSDKVDYNTQDLFLGRSDCAVAGLDAVSGKPLALESGLDLFTVNEFALIRDADLFIKAVEEAARLRQDEIDQLEKGLDSAQDKAQQWKAFQSLSPVEYLNRAIVPLLVPGLQRLDK
jgi:hypothetical protein